MLALSGCAGSLLTGSPLESTVQPEWAVPLGEVEMLRATPDGETVLVGNDRTVAVVDGSTGGLAGGEQGAFSANRVLKEAASVSVDGLGSFGLGDYQSDNYTPVMLTDAGVVLLAEYSGTEDRVVAVSEASGERLWINETWDWDRQAGGELAGDVAGKLAERIFGSENVQETDDGREISEATAADMALEIGDGETFLFLTKEALHRVETMTGEERWAIPDVAGEMLPDAVPLPDGDLLVGTRSTNLVTGTANAELLRIDPATGDVRWRTPYSGGVLSTPTLRLVGDRVLVAFPDGYAEVYDLATGAELVSSREEDDQRHLLSTGLTARAAVADDAVYTLHTLNFRAVGNPDVAVRKYDLETGEQLWTSAPVEKRTELRDLYIVGDFVIARSAGMGIGAAGTAQVQKGGVHAWSTDTGEVTWTALDGEKLSDLVLAGGTLYVATPEKVVALDPATGDVAAETSFADAEIGDTRRLMGTGTALAVVADNGVAFFERDELGLRQAIPLEGTVGRVAPADDRLFLGVSTGLLKAALQGVHIVDLEREALVGSVGLAGAEQSLETNFLAGYDRDSGDLYYAFHPDADGQGLYVLGEDLTLTRYAFAP